MKLSILFPAVLLFCFCTGYAHAQADSAGNNNKAHYLSNVFSVMPFQFTENGLGLGVSYERVFGKKGVVAFCIPAIVTFNVANSSRIYDYNTGNYNTGKADALFYTMPGIKIYPTGCYGKIKYATGASLVIGSGQQSSYVTDLGGLNTTELIQRHFFAGAMWQNSLNMKIDRRLFISVETGAGETFINKAGGTKEQNKFLAQGSFKIGYRF